MDKDKIQEMQMLEQNLQNLLMQKQVFQMELSETSSALHEVKNAGEEIFKIAGQLMIKTDKPKVKEDLEKKEKMLKLRTETIEKQESQILEKLDKLKEEFIKSQKNK